ncbi:AAA family ATPase [Amphibacillus cookii]|uniref:AAA family ATPase n=1 Tax=Amphibacillus cookii TaxID=767787 RepID=UPI00195C6F8F|nr:AAA family ATPase [Amphibacillus cookii]MBM7541294.1 putative ATPase [Amphibacillus cookii]
MVRLAEVNKVWELVYKRNYDHLIKSIELNGIGGINKVEFEKGIFAICGLNGAGKSTIISSLKDVLGIKTNTQDKKKINGNSIEAQVLSKSGDLLEVSNADEERLVNITGDDDSVYYLDYKLSLDALEFLEQDNLDELLEQYDENIIPSNQIQSLNYIIGKDYDEVKLIEIEDGSEIIPYFKVKTAQLEYNSLGMGIGEHFLFYIFWVFYRIKGTGIILIEEPETFISINSQQKLMNFIADYASKQGITVILASHSPYIIKKIKKENIIILSRYSNQVSIIKPSVNKDSLVSLGLELPKEGCIYVEDKIAELFLKTVLSRNCPHILRDYNIEYVEGHASITKRLMFPKSDKFTYKLIGLYDGDIREEIEEVKDKLSWEYSFLPTEMAIEMEFKKCLREKTDEFATSLGIDKSNLIHILTTINGEDHHDWFIELCRKSGKDKVILFEKLYELWVNDETNQTKTESFIKELMDICY